MAQHIDASVRAAATAADQTAAAWAAVRVAEQGVHAAWAGAWANFAVVLVTAFVAGWNIWETRQAKAALLTQQKIAAYIGIAQTLTLLDLLVQQVQAVGLATPVNFGFLRVGTRAAVAAATHTIGRDIPDGTMFNLATHALTLATSVDEDLQRRSVETPNLSGGDYLDRTQGFLRSRREQQALLLKRGKELKIPERKEPSETA